ncbi:MAG: hypothetical protein UY23_C0001G0224 [Candidatus Jorgensenbacteria bacterium GW2011_GWA1_48_11]|uniref:Uncharacterized protein n=1 Tax=Candidatus Jorgensenbacteria bacterium GW2011_GWA1_48_11 TaxID=1618660 RepID=A0A0G1WMS3_9BACT|nr:MAG: hypothetical protein UY23_C0001G0224 [Candidatus Jorgensenbacteria bacterium GW2011_GWA1_48_11]KKW12110.1 MAG: hypothetical protein UY51_C0005G0352 [Candidatus Jorgensenbacteria bacterium GW2011_GWB1_49_9]
MTILWRLLVIGVVAVAATAGLKRVFNPDNKDVNATTVKTDTLWATTIVERVRSVDGEFYPNAELTVRSWGIDDYYSWSGHCPGYFRVFLPANDPFVASIKANSAV